MALTTEDEVREWVGRSVTPDDISDALDRFDDDPLLAARSILRRTLADLALAPGELSVDQDYQRKWLEWQVALIERRIAAVESETAEVEEPGLPVVTVGALVRDCPGR